VRNALIVLGVVALVLVTLGAVNHDLLFDIDFVIGTWTAVSLFWVAVVFAGVVLFIGVVAAFLARAGVVAAQRKLEKELQGTYERLRAAEAEAAPRPVPTKAAVGVTPGEQTAITSVVPVTVADETRAVTGASADAETAVTSASPAVAIVGPDEGPAGDAADAPSPSAS
jgi:hypothetical protein